LDIKKHEKEEAKRPRRRAIAKRRAKLGFNDNGAEEMDDADIDRFEDQIETAARTAALAQKKSGKIILPIEFHGPIDA